MNRFWNWFDNSSTILWSRFQVLFGCIWTVLSITDMAPWMPPKYIPIWAIINGIVTEYLRRIQTQTITSTVMDRVTGAQSDIKYLKTDSIVPSGATLIREDKK